MTARLTSSLGKQQPADSPVAEPLISGLVGFIEGDGRSGESYDDSWAADLGVASAPPPPERGLKEPRGYACR